MVNGKGYLVLIGGAEDRTGRRRILRKVLNLNEGKRVAIIPSATMYASETIADYRDIFLKIGADRVWGIDIRRRSEGDRKEYLETLEECDVIFFTGGDQTRLVDLLESTKALDKIWERYGTDNVVIAGTSAGAAAAGDFMIYDGDGNGFNKSSIKHSSGFGFIKGITIDTHFMARRRISRLSQFLASGKSHKGIGISEDTAIVVFPDQTFEVIGRDVVTVMNSKELWYSNYDRIDTDEHVTVDGVNVGFLSHGTRFDLKRWRVDEGETALIPREAKDDILTEPEKRESPMATYRYESEYTLRSEERKFERRRKYKRRGRKNRGRRKR